MCSSFTVVQRNHSPLLPVHSPVHTRTLVCMLGGILVGAYSYTRMHSGGNILSSCLQPPGSLVLVCMQTSCRRPDMQKTMMVKKSFCRRSRLTSGNLISALTCTCRSIVKVVGLGFGAADGGTEVRASFARSLHPPLRMSATLCCLARKLTHAASSAALPASWHCWHVQDKPSGASCMRASDMPCHHFRRRWLGLDEAHLLFLF